MERSFEDLFSLTVFHDDGSKHGPSDPGDSGSVVVDSAGHPLGVIIGGDDLYSYAAKFSNIFYYKDFTNYKFLNI